MISTIQLNNLTVEVTRKKMKNLRLKVYPNGMIKLSAPLHAHSETIHCFLISKLNWIQQTQKQLQQQRETTRLQESDNKSRYVWGKRYLLNVIEQDTRPKITLTHNEMHLHVRPKTSPKLQQAIIDEWLRYELKKALPPLLEKWQPIMGVVVNKFFVQKMKSRWGSCNYTQGNVRFNSELAKKPPECLEYVVVHELAHLLEPSHNARFHSLMSQFLPNWKLIKAELNRFPSTQNQND
jgi:predicted metal-dependent hydrolase